MTFTPINEPDTLCTCGAEKDRHGPALECPPRVALVPLNLSPEAYQAITEMALGAPVIEMPSDGSLQLVDPDGEHYRPEVVAVGEFAMPESQDAADVASEPSNWDVVDRDEVEMLWLEAENVVLCLHCASKRGVTPGQPGTDPVERGDDYVREGGHCFDCGESPYSPDLD